MARYIRSALLVLVVLIIAAIGYGIVVNPERANLDAAARTLAPGRFVVLPNGSTHYEMGGPDSGPVVVLVHGFSVPAYIWDSTFRALGAAGYRTLRYDLYGRGWSDRPDATYDGALYDAQLAGLLDSLSITTPIHLMGLSFGGFVTAHFTASYPERVRTLTLVDPVSTSPAFPSFLSVPVLGPFLFQASSVPGMADNQVGDFLHPEHHSGWADRYRPQMHYRGFGRSLFRSVRTMSTTDFPALYASVANTNVPVLLIWGQQDAVVPISQSTVIRTSIPHVEFFPVDSAGHLPHMEQSAVVNGKLLQFLSTH